MQQHQVSARIHVDRTGDLGPIRTDVVTPSRRANVNDVIVQPHRPIGGDMTRLDVDHARIPIVRRGSLSLRERPDQTGESKDEGNPDKSTVRDIPGAICTGSAKRAGPERTGPRTCEYQTEVKWMTYLRTSAAASAMAVAFAAADLVSLNAKFLEILPPAL